MSDEPAGLLKEQNEVLEKEIGYLREKLKEKRAYIADLEEEDEKRNRELGEKDAQIKDFKKLVEAQKAFISELKEELWEHQEIDEDPSMNSFIIKLKRETRELREKLEEKAAKIQGLKSVISELECEDEAGDGNCSSLSEEFAELYSIKDDSSEDDAMHVAGKIARGFNSFSRIQNGKIGNNSFNHPMPKCHSTLIGQSSSNFSGFAPLIPAATTKFPSLFKKLDDDGTTSSSISAQLPVFDESPRPSSQGEQADLTFAQLNELIANDNDFDKICDEIMANVVNQRGNSGGEQFSNGNEQLMLMAQQDSGIGDIDNDDNIRDHGDGNETKEEGEKKEEMEEEEEREEVERQEEELEEQMGEELEDTGSSEEVKTEDNDELGEEEEGESADPVLPEEVEHRNGGPEHLHGWFGADRVDFSRHPQAVAGEQPPQLCFDRVQAAGRGVRRRLMRKMGAWIFMPLYRSTNF